MDRLLTLIDSSTFNTRVFYNGEFCGAQDFAENGQVGQLHLIRHGPVIIHPAGQVPVRIEEPALVFYPRGMSHRLVVPAGTSASLLCASTSFLGGSRNPLARALPEFLQVPMAKMDRLAQTLRLLFDEASLEQCGRDLILDRLCDVLIVQVIRHAFQTRQLSTGMLTGFSDPKLSRALAAMHGKPQHPWLLEDLAKIAGMSRSKFADYFQQTIGIPPGEYLTQWRIGLAQSLLRKGKSVKAVSQEVGYGSQPAFSRAFTEKTGISPRAWLNLTKGV